MHVWKNVVWIVFPSYYRVCNNGLSPTQKRVHVLKRWCKQQLLLLLLFFKKKKKKSRMAYIVVTTIFMTERSEEYLTMFKPAPITPTSPLQVSPCNANWVVTTVAVKITTSKIKSKMVVLPLIPFVAYMSNRIMYIVSTTMTKPLTVATRYFPAFMIP